LFWEKENWRGEARRSREKVRAGRVDQFGREATEKRGFEIRENIKKGRRSIFFRNAMRPEEKSPEHNFLKRKKTFATVGMGWSARKKRVDWGAQKSEGKIAEEGPTIPHIKEREMRDEKGGESSHTPGKERKKGGAVNNDVLPKNSKRKRKKGAHVSN